jgi:hypothetical protein
MIYSSLYYLMYLQSSNAKLTNAPPLRDYGPLSYFRPFYDLQKIYLHFIYLFAYSPKLGSPLIAERLSPNLKMAVSSVSHRFTQFLH